MPFKGDMITDLWGKEKFAKERFWEWHKVKFLVKVQWICSFFQIPWNHMQPQRERTCLQHSLPYLRYLPPLLWLLLFLFGQWSKLFQYFLIKYTQFPLLPLGQPSNWPAFFLICMSWAHSWMSKVLTNAEQSAHHSRLLSLMHAVVVSVLFARAYCCLPVTYDPS